MADVLRDGLGPGDVARVRHLNHITPCGTLEAGFSANPPRTMRELGWVPAPPEEHEP